MANATVPQEVTIKHGAFWYHVEENVIINGAEEPRLIEHTAFHNETITVTRQADLDRGLKIDAFYSEDELKQLQGSLPSAPATPVSDEDQRAIADLDDEELVDWIMSTGEFDGNKKPTAQEVLDAVGDDKELASRVIAAENTAGAGGDARKTVIEPLEARINA